VEQAACLHHRMGNRGLILWSGQLACPTVWATAA
jgi:hypothetical protein